MIYCAQVTFKTWEISMLVLIFNSNKSLVVVFNYIFHILQSLTLKYFTNVKKLMYVKKNVKTSKKTSKNWRTSNIWLFLNMCLIQIYHSGSRWVKVFLLPIWAWTLWTLRSCSSQMLLTLIANVLSCCFWTLNTWIL